MATRSTIAILREDGTVAQVYCHWDGYLDNNGRILVEHYTDPAKIEQLIALGDLSSLGPNIGEAHEFDCPHKYGTPEWEKWTEDKRGICTFYGRDRGEKNINARIYRTLGDYESNMQSEEYDYLFMYGEWVYRSYDGLVRTVVDGLAMEAAEEAA